MEEGKQENQEIEEIEEVEIVFGDVEPELLNNTTKQHFGEDAAAEEPWKPLQEIILRHCTDMKGESCFSKKIPLEHISS